MAFEQVLTTDQLPVGSARAVELGGEPICVVRTDESTVKALHDTCSHQQYSLAEGWVEIDTPASSSEAVGGRIECALHGSAFNLDTGQPESLPAVKPVPVYACEIRDGGIWVDQADQRNDADVPRH
jgi:3-phenylpropionate/trans-cinnamate dioxygenase ferredoxin subunit